MPVTEFQVSLVLLKLEARDEAMPVVRTKQPSEVGFRFLLPIDHSKLHLQVTP